MKTKLIPFIAVLLLISACSKKEISTTISGQLPDIAYADLQLVAIEDYFPGLLSNNVIAQTRSDSLGNFTFKLSQANAGFYQIINANYHRLHYDIYLESGDSIYIQQSSWNDDPLLIISGEGSSKLEYLLSDYLIFPKKADFYEKIRSNSFETEFAFRAFLDSIQNLRFSTLAANNLTPENLKNHFENVIKAEHAVLLLEHLESRNRNIGNGYDYYYPDSSYLSFISNINFDSKFCQSAEARNLAGVYLNMLAKAHFKNQDQSIWWNENLSWKMNFISDQPKNEWNDLLALSTIREYSFGLMQDDFFEQLSNFNQKMENNFFADAKYQLFKANASDYFALSPGNPAPNFSLPDSSGTIVKLSDFKGKIVYIDFWGTWCYPCIQEIPDALELQEKYADQPVVFLYVALEYDEQNITEWKEFIAGRNKRFEKFLNKPFPGIHVVAEKQFRNEEIKPYKINFAPTHVLIDQDGRIVSARADRSKTIGEKIDALLSNEL
jgi:thiol-disulfide isomerase/thioredoxin